MSANGSFCPHAGGETEPRVMMSIWVLDFIAKWFRAKVRTLDQRLLRIAQLAP